LVFALISSVSLFAYFKFTTNGRHSAPIIGAGIQTLWDVKQNPDAIFQHSNSDIVNILLIGRDVNWKIGKVLDPRTGKYRSYQVVDQKTPARSDTMIVVSLDKGRNEIHMISLPRDAWIHLPPNKYDVRMGKLNAAHAYGGPELLVKTIHDELGLTIHHYAVIRFEGFKKLIDEVGGVQVNVLGALKRGGKRGDLIYNDNWGNLHINLKPGLQTLDGQQAHNYVRFRMDLEGDPGRIKRQQQVIRALAKSLMHQPFYKIPPLVDEVRKQFATDMTNLDIASAADYAKNIGDSSKIQPLTMFGTYNTRGKLLLNKEKNIKLFNYLFGSTFNESHFLQNSPSTDSDEMGLENNSSPGSKSILIKAGLLKGSNIASSPAENTQPSTSELSVPSTDSTPSRVAVTTDDGGNITSPSSETKPRRSRSRRERSEASEDNSANESSSVKTPRDRVDLSVPDDEKRSSDDSEAPARDSSGESPVPRPEREHSSSHDESPVPRAE
jgi:LCP family protein required for cell wall assembly